MAHLKGRRLLLSTGAMLPSAIEKTLLDFFPVDIKGLASNLYLPQVDGWPQCANTLASAIDVGTVPSNTARQFVSSLSSLLPSLL